MIDLANAARATLPEPVPPEAWSLACVAACAEDRRLGALLALGEPDGSRRVVAALVDDRRGRIQLRATCLRPGQAYPALSASLPQAQAFERELHEEHGILPAGHPWLKPLRGHAELHPGSAAEHPFFRVDGPDVHEVAVGPVHAGIIEPGHFRFQCHGEAVLHLEIQLGYQRRGAEEVLVRSAPARRLVVAESISGDTAVGHALAHVLALEALAEAEVPLRAQVLRGIALELERLANHAGDLGALCADVGYLPGASYLGRLRGEFLNLLLDLAGNRFGRGLVVAGGVRFDLAESMRADFVARLAGADRDLRATADLVLDAPSVLARFEHTGTVTPEVAHDLGLVGPAARASGLDRDVRKDHPHGVYRFAHIPSAIASDGDVLARALVRRIEAERSLTFLREQLEALPSGPVRVPVGPAAPDSVAVALVEGWRGEILHALVTGLAGAPRAYKVVDPSFHNWPALAMAMRSNAVSDFPLTNKSFNLAYAGHDL